MTAKHPPTFDCGRCARSYRHLFALEDHYRGSPYHPNCSRCGKGFKDEPELEEHRQTAHIQRPCTPCHGELVYQDQDSLDRHYANSERHSKCATCGKGFRDEATLRSHASTEHSPTTPSPAHSPLLEPHIAPSPPRPEVPSKDVLSSSPTSLGNHLYSSRLSPTLSSKSGNLFKEFTPSYGSRRISESPELSRLSLSFGGAGAPLFGLQPPAPFSPAGLIPPGREANELWNSKMNVQIPSPSNGTRATFPFEPSPVLPRNRFPMTADPNRSLGNAVPPPPLPNGSNGMAAHPSRFGFCPTLSRPPASLPSLSPGKLHASNDFNDAPQPMLCGPRAAVPVGPPQYTVPGERTSPPRMIAFAVSTPAGSLPGKPTNLDILPSPSPPFNLAIGRKLSSATPPPASIHPMNGLSSVPIVARSVAEIEQQRSLTQSQASSETCALTLQNLLLDADGYNSILEESDTETPKVSQSLQHRHQRVVTDGDGSNSCKSELGLLSSPSFSLSSSKEALLSSTLNDPLVLENMEPLAGDSPWLETQVPLPESLPGSPIVAGASLLERPTVIDISSTVEEASSTAGDNPKPLEPLFSLTNSPATTFHTPEPTVDTEILESDAQERSGSSCLIAKGSHEDQEPHVPDDPDPTPIEPLPLPPLHCRSCKADSCKEITATMCGHVFCNSCIVDAVIKTSKCPFCFSPTLLYCLFKLHL